MKIKIIRRYTILNGTEVAEYEIGGRLPKGRRAGRGERVTEGKSDKDLIKAIKDSEEIFAKAAKAKRKPGSPPIGSLAWRMDAESGDGSWGPSFPDGK